MLNLSKIDDIILKNIIIKTEAINNEFGRLDGMRLSFSPTNEDKIYHKSNGQPVQFFPKNLGINLDMRALIKLNSMLIETLSSYLFNIRHKVYNRDLIEIIESRIDDKKSLKIRVSGSFFREEEKGRYKISIAVINKGDDLIDDNELVNINLSKRDVTILSSMIKLVCSSYLRQAGITTTIKLINKETQEEISERWGTITKIDSSLLIDNVWLHGQELLNIMYIVDKLIFSLHIEKNLDSIQSIYRQLRFTRVDDIMYMHLTKMNMDHDEEKLYTEDNVEYEIKIPLSAEVLSYFYVSLNIDVLRHADFTTGNQEILGSSRINLGKVKYHITMKESAIGIGIVPKPKSPDDSKILLVGKAKDGAFTEINDMDDELVNYTKIFNKEGEKIFVPALQEFSIDLKDQWHKLIAGLAMAYTKEYVTEEKTYNKVKFFVINMDSTGKYKYEFSIYADSNNKAPAVLIINKYKLKKDVEDELIARYRQPLFDKYIFQILSIILAASEDIPNIELLEDTKKNDLLEYEYKSFENVTSRTKDKPILYGIKKNDEGVLIGNFTDKKDLIKLSEQDLILLNMTSGHRLLRGYWIPFVGDQIAIGQDGYLTDMYGELQIEIENKGAFWATKFYFGSAR